MAWRILTAVAPVTMTVTMAMMMTGRPAQAEPPRLAKGLEAGEWELRERGAGGETRRLCVSDLRQLLQLRHGRGSCKSFTVDDTQSRAAVTYECGAAGNGRTDLRIETPRLIQIRSQGIAEGAPFQFALEGRWVGPCR